MQFGADKIFTSAVEEMEDEDLEELLERGEEKAKKMDQMVEDKIQKELAAFKTDIADLSLNTISCFDFENQDYRDKRRQMEQDAISAELVKYMESDMGTSKREHKDVTNYNIDNHYKYLMAVNQKPKGPVEIKAPKLNEYHFYKDKASLAELIRKEKVYKRGPGRNRTAEERDNDRYGLTEEEVIQKQELLATGFPEWEKKEINTFIEGMKNYGRDAFDKISEDIPTKTLLEIEQYSEVFWENILTLANGEKIMKGVEKREKERKHLKNIESLISSKVKAYQFPRTEMKFKFVKYDDESLYSKDEDAALICFCMKNK
jgi:SWI/SNF-related matrix-associated actin-dependent regulator of chromatin subfamily A member 5